MVYDLASSLVSDRTPLPAVGTLPRTPHAYGAQAEFGYKITGGMGIVPTRHGHGTVTLTGTSGWMHLHYFRAPRTQLLSRWDLATVSQAYAATPTLIRGGLYTIDSLGNLTQAAASPNDTTLGAVGNTKFGKAFSTPLEVYFGLWYVFGFLAVTATTPANLLGPALAGASNIAMNSDPRANGVVTGLSDLPASVAFGSVAASNIALWGELT
jgi:hypothetical protein